MVRNHWQEPASAVAETGARKPLLLLPSGPLRRPNREPRLKAESGRRKIANADQDSLFPYF